MCLKQYLYAMMCSEKYMHCHAVEQMDLRKQLRGYVCMYVLSARSRRY